MVYTNEVTFSLEASTDNPASQRAMQGILAQGLFGRLTYLQPAHGSSDWQALEKGIPPQADRVSKQHSAGITSLHTSQQSKDST